MIFDLATFLINLERTLLNPQAWLLAGSGATLRQTFVQSYLDGNEDGIALPLASAAEFMVLRRWGDLGLGPRSRVGHHRFPLSPPRFQAGRQDEPAPPAGPCARPG